MMIQKMLALVLSVSLLVATNAPAFAQSKPSPLAQFQKSRVQMASALPFLQTWEDMDYGGHAAVVMFSVLVTGIVALGIYAAEADGVKILPRVSLKNATFDIDLLERIALNKSIDKWNRFAVELSDIGVPLELDAYAINLTNTYSGASRDLYFYDNFWCMKEEMVGHLHGGYWKDGEKIVNQWAKNLSKEEAGALVKEYVKIQKQLQEVVRGINRSIDVYYKPDKYTPSVTEATKYFSAETNKTLEMLRAFKAKYPQLTYAAPLDRYSAKEVILVWEGLVPKNISAALDRLFNPAKIGAAEREAVAARAAASRGFLTRAKSWVGKLGRRGPTHAAEKSATKAGKVGVVALVAMIGVGVAQASELQQADAEIQQRMIENPMLAVELSAEDAQFIEQHADSLPKTIETYSAIAQGLYEFSQLSTQEQQDIVALLTEDTQKASSTRHAVPTLKSVRAR